jgi:hypothetical protein
VTIEQEGSPLASGVLLLEGVEAGFVHRVLRKLMVLTDDIRDAYFAMPERAREGMRWMDSVDETVTEILEVIERRLPVFRLIIR